MLPSPSSTYDGDAISQDLTISHCRIHIIRPGQALHKYIDHGSLNSTTADEGQTVSYKTTPIGTRP